jgi:hypothetical protein
VFVSIIASVVDQHNFAQSVITIEPESR